MSTEDLNSLSDAVAGNHRRVMLQTNVFGTMSTETAAGAPPGREANASYAAGWASLARSLDLPADFEIGNEPEHFVVANQEEDFSQIPGVVWETPWDWVHDYIDEFKLHARAIRQADPAARIFGPATNTGSSDETDPNWNCPSADALPWTQPEECGRLQDTRALKASDGEALGYRGSAKDHVGWRVLDNWLRETSNAAPEEQPDGVSIHYYPGTEAFARGGSFPISDDDSNDGFSWAVQRSAAQSFRYHYDRVRELIRYWYGHDLPIVVSEWHSGYPYTTSDRTSQNASVGSALQQLDTVGMFAQVGVESHAFYSVHDAGPGKFSVWGGNHSSVLYGMLTGFTDQHATRVIGPARSPDEATATFYAMAMWGALMDDEVLASPLRTGHYSEAEVSTYATKSPDGNIQILVVNKTSDAIELSMDFTDMSSNDYSSFEATWISAPPGTHDGTILSASQPYLNGVAWSASDLFLPPPVPYLALSGQYPEHLVPPYAAIVLEFDPTSLPCSPDLGCPE